MLNNVKYKRPAILIWIVGRNTRVVCRNSSGDLALLTYLFAILTHYGENRQIPVLSPYFVWVEIIALLV